MQQLRRIIKIGRKIGRWLFAACLIGCACFASAQADERQYKVEAAFLYSFFNYIAWPGYPSPHALQKPVICVYGNDPIIPYLEYVRDRMADARHLSVRRVSEGEAVQGCHILFMRHRVTHYSVPPATLAVFKPDDPLDQGGMIELIEDGERIAIKMRQSALEKDGFIISSRLLALVKRE